MQKYKEINGNDYVKNSRTTINETMQSIQSMNSGTAFPTNNLFEGMKCYRTDLKKTYTLTDVENNTWVEDAHATLADTATKLQTPRTLSLTGKAAGSATFDGSSNASINVTSVNADTASKLSTARKINITGNATGAAAFDGSGDVSINVTVNESKHAVNADVAKTLETTDANGVKSNGKFYWIGKGGQPMWLWGSNTKPSETYVYNPSNFHVAKADTATTADNSNKLCGYPMRPHTQGGRYGTIPFVETDGVMEVGRYIDWHATEGGTEDYSSRWEAQNNGTVSVGTINGTLNGNAATASKLATARAISLTGNASGSANFDGSGNISINTTVSRASVADVVHKAIQPRGVYKIENYIFYGTLTIPQNGDFFKLEVLGGSGHNSQIGQSREGTLYFRTGNGNPAHYAAYSEYHRNGASNFKFFIVKDSGTQYRIYGGPTSYTGTMQIIPYIGQNSSFELALNDVSALPNGAVEVEQQQLIYASTVNNFAPTKTGGGASGTWGISISGNAASATTATKANTASSVAWSGVTGKPGTYPPSAHNHDSAYPSVTGARASGTWGINISGNAKTATTATAATNATNADKVDGYHAADLFRTLAGHKTPVMTDIFDRAGTIDMSTMSAADKARDKANINKAQNMTQNLWNTSTGIYAYGGDNGIAGGYHKGTLKLTQSYKNFDKILVVSTNDDGNVVIHKLWDVYELAYTFSHSYQFPIYFDDDRWWYLFGNKYTGTNTDYSLSTDTIWSCQNRCGGIIAIYGIKY